ncbi:hypothetical protein DDZ16_12240 [Marinilabilia rubra]|uniref:Uncharacterized protein n=1 Tax=Marinilabilia rubra TaxID=2162893 RepID=A0A2U2B7J3_9BACT|nr:hypothetical protein DDZ16_12240 [Marinilabilia rubra]
MILKMKKFWSLRSFELKIERLISLCKKTPTTSLFLLLNQSFTKSKLLGFNNFESLVFGAFLSKTENTGVFLLTLIMNSKLI